MLWKKISSPHLLHITHHIISKGLNNPGKKSLTDDRNTLCLDIHENITGQWSHGSWIYNYLCNQCLSALTLWVRIPLRRAVLDTTLCDEVCQRFATGQWFSPGTPVSSTNKTDCHDIPVTEILLKVVLNTIISPWKFYKI
jgi:hypothetical protein